MQTVVVGSVFPDAGEDRCDEPTEHPSSRYTRVFVLLSDWITKVANLTSVSTKVDISYHDYTVAVDGGPNFCSATTPTFFDKFHKFLRRATNNQHATSAAKSSIFTLIAFKNILTHLSPPSFNLNSYLSIAIELFRLIRRT